MLCDTIGRKNPAKRESPELCLCKSVVSIGIYSTMDSTQALAEKNYLKRIKRNHNEQIGQTSPVFRIKKIKIKDNRQTRTEEEIGKIKQQM